VHINAEYPVHEQRRDRAVQGVLQLSHIQLKAHHGSVIVPPVITTQSGSVYQKFTPFSRAWRDYVLAHGVPRCAALPNRKAVAAAAVPSVDYPRRDSSAWPAGEAAAQHALN